MKIDLRIKIAYYTNIKKWIIYDEDTDIVYAVSDNFSDAWDEAKKVIYNIAMEIADEWST